VRLAPKNAESDKLNERIRDWGTAEFLPGLISGYPNLYPEDKPVGTSHAGELVGNNKDGWTIRATEASVALGLKSSSPMIKPKGLYNFITINGRVFAAHNAERQFSIAVPRNGHVSLSGGREVEYAGMIRFSKTGRLRFWSNASGHYEPHPALRFKANLPADWPFKAEKPRDPKWNVTDPTP
jgi:hypothetical protein